MSPLNDGRYRSGLSLLEHPRRTRRNGLDVGLIGAHRTERIESRLLIAFVADRKSGAKLHSVQRPDSRLAAFYEARAREEPEHDPEAALRFRKALRAADLSPGERLLDIGAKWGGLGSYARGLGLDIEYRGLELSAENIEKAGALGLDVRHSDASERLPVGDHEYDCVVCLELLEHLPKPIALLAEFRRVLKDDGRAVISVPNPYSWVEIYRELFRRPDPEGHLNAFTTPVIENLLALAGLRIERRLGTSLRIPRTLRLIPTNSILARSRMYIARPAERVAFAGREH